MWFVPSPQPRRASTLRSGWPSHPARRPQRSHLSRRCLAQTSQPLASSAIVPNIALKQAIDEFFANANSKGWARPHPPNARALGFSAVLASNPSALHRWGVAPAAGGGRGTRAAQSKDPSGLWRIPEENLTLGKAIDRGSFGEVRRGTLRDDQGQPVPVAVKVIASPLPPARLISAALAVVWPSALA